MQSSLTSRADTDVSLRDELLAAYAPRRVHEPRDSSSERWAAIPGFASRYSVSDTGQVLRLPLPRSADVRLWNPLLLTPTFSGGYFWVALRSGRNERRLFRLDRIVLCSFAGRPLEVFDVGYRNGDRCDLRLENLERLNTMTVLGPPGTRRLLIDHTSSTSSANHAADQAACIE